MIDPGVEKDLGVDVFRGQVWLEDISAVLMANINLNILNRSQSGCKIN